jgi:hypothetical protein
MEYFTGIHKVLRLQETCRKSTLFLLPHERFFLCITMLLCLPRIMQCTD